MQIHPSITSSPALYSEAGPSSYTPPQNPSYLSLPPQWLQTPPTPQQDFQQTTSESSASSPASLASSVPSLRRASSVSALHRRPRYHHEEVIAAQNLSPRPLTVSLEPGLNHTTHAASDARRRKRVGKKVKAAVDLCWKGVRLGAELLDFVPIPGLAAAAKVLVNIWDTVERMEASSISCVRLTERCADILVNVQEAIINAGWTITAQLEHPLQKLSDAIFQLEHFTLSYLNQSGFRRWTKSEDFMNEIKHHDQSLTDALWLFNFSIQIMQLRVLTSEADETIQNDGFSEPVFLHQGPDRQSSLESELGSLRGLPDVPDSMHSSFLAESPSEEHPPPTQHFHQRHIEKQNLNVLLLAILNAPTQEDVVRVLRSASNDSPATVKALNAVLTKAKLSSDQATPTGVIPQRRSPTWPLQRLQADPSLEPFYQTLRFIELKNDALERILHTAVDLPCPAIFKHELDHGRVMHRGRFSDVYHGVWRKHDVAIKVMIPGTNPRLAAERFKSELDIWNSLKHSNILELYGVSNIHGKHPCYFVSPYMDYGNLSNYLKDLAWRISGTPHSQTVDTTMLLGMMTDVAKGLAYIHERKIIHGDIKASNILVCEDMRCLITDFGHSVRVGMQKADWFPHDSFRWRSPELHDQRFPTKAGDVYSYGICCVEILTMGSMPWSTLSDDEVRALIQDQQPLDSLIPEAVLLASNSGNSSLPSVLELLSRVCHASPSQRPLMDDVAHALRTLKINSNSPSFLLLAT